MIYCFLLQFLLPSLFTPFPLGVEGRNAGLVNYETDGEIIGDLWLFFRCIASNPVGTIVSRDVQVRAGKLIILKTFWEGFRSKLSLHGKKEECLLSLWEREKSNHTRLTINRFLFEQDFISFLGFSLLS